MYRLSDPSLPVLGVPVRVWAGLLAHLLRPDVLSVRLHEVLAPYLRTSVQPLPKTSSWVSAQRTFEVETSTLVLPTARSVAPRPEHVLCQTALTPTLSQWVPALELIHPHVTLGPCTQLEYKASTVRGQRRRAVSACSQSLTCAITCDDVGADARLPDRSVRSTRTRQGNSGKLLLAGPLGPRPLGPSFKQALSCGTADRSVHERATSCSALWAQKKTLYIKSIVSGPPL